MEMEVKPKKQESVNKTLYLLELKLLKTIPPIIALIHIVNVATSYIGIPLPILSYIGGISFIPLLFMYISSYAFKFCEYHRMFLHYAVIDNLICIYDLYVGIPVNDFNMFKIHIVVLGISLFVILYLYLKSRRDEKRSNKITRKNTR